MLAYFSIVAAISIVLFVAYLSLSGGLEDYDDEDID